MSTHRCRASCISLIVNTSSSVNSMVCQKCRAGFNKDAKAKARIKANCVRFAARLKIRITWTRSRKKLHCRKLCHADCNIFRRASNGAPTGAWHSLRREKFDSKEKRIPDVWISVFFRENSYTNKIRKRKKTLITSLLFPNQNFNHSQKKVKH